MKTNYKVAIALIAGTRKGSLLPTTWRQTLRCYDLHKIILTC
jgi:hypothetical protein